MSALPPTTLSALSANVRSERARLRAMLAAGGSLGVLLGERRCILDGVQVLNLLRWMPGVGASKAHQLARGLPIMARVCDLTPNQLHELAERVANYERAKIALRIKED